MPSNLNQSSLYKQGTTGMTQSVVSSRFKIYSPVVGIGKFVKLGVCSAFNVSESKNVEAIRGLGYGDQIAELVPGVTSPVEISITRTMLYLADIMQMLGYKSGVSGAVRSLKHHKWPFDLKTEILFSDIASEDPGIGDAQLASIPSEGGLNNLGNPGLYCVQTCYEGCWVTSYSRSTGTETAAVSEDVNIQVTDIFDISGSIYGEFIDSGNNNTDITGRSLIFAENNINA